MLGRTARRFAGDASWRGARLDYRPGDNRHATQLACEHGHRRKVFERRPARIVTRITASSVLSATTADNAASRALIEIHGTKL
jgi:hypothetical protein